MTDKTYAALSATGIVAGALVALGIIGGVTYTAHVNGVHEHNEKIACIDAGGSYLPISGSGKACIGGSK